MKELVGAFNQEKALLGPFANLRNAVSAPDHLVTLLVPQLGVDDAALEPLLAGQRGPVRVLVAVVAHAAEQHVAGEHNT